jgi:hypothetical protein
MQGRKPFPFLACGLAYTFIRAAGIVKRNCAVFQQPSVFHYCGQKDENLHFCSNKTGRGDAVLFNMLLYQIVVVAFQNGTIFAAPKQNCSVCGKESCCRAAVRVFENGP